MNLLDEAKRSYDSIPIPDELSERVQLEIKRAEDRQKERHRTRIISLHSIQRIAATAAAMLIIFTGALNTSMAFAEGAAELPVIGALAKVLTFRSYETETEIYDIAVDIPSIDMISEDFGDLEKEINQEILELCEEYAAQAQKRALEYREAFLATGGTEEEWAAHNIQIKVWYEVLTQTEGYLSLAIEGSESWTSAYNRTRYYNIDLDDGRLLTLRDVLGDDYKHIADESIRAQMEERRLEGATYFDDFKGIAEDQDFYLNEAGDPVIVFEAYEIAPGSESKQEFTIEIP